MYDDALILIDKVAAGTDKHGNEVFTETATLVLCEKKSVARTEFYLAARTDLRPEIVLEIHTYEYAGQKKVEFENVRYTVLRAYSPTFETTELICGRRTGDGGD